jgi:hypothetical protein
MSQPKAAPAPAPAPTPAPMQQPAPASAPMQQPPAPEPAPAPPQQQPAAPAGDEYFAGMGPYEIRLRKGMSVDQIYDTMMANPAYKLSDNPRWRNVQERQHRTRAETYHRQLTASNGPVRDININTPNFSFKGPTLRPASPIAAQQPTPAQSPQQSTPSPVQTPPPITPQPTTPITDAPPTAPPVTQQSPAPQTPAPQTTPITDTPAQSPPAPSMPAPPAAPSSAYKPPEPIYGKQDDSILPEAKKQQSFFGTPEESFKTIGQAIEDVSILTGVGRTDPNVNWSFDAIGASNADTGALQEAESVRLQQQAQEEVKNQVSKKIQEDQQKEMSPQQNRFTDTSTPMGILPSFGLSGVASIAVDSAKQLAGTGTAAAAAPQAAKAVIPAAAESILPAAAKAALPAAAESILPEAAVPMTTWLKNLAVNTPANALKYTTETASALKSAPLTTLATGGKNAVGLAKNTVLFPFANPVTNVAIDAVMTAVENKSVKNIMANSDAWGDWANYAQKKLTDAQGELVKGNVLNFLGGTAQGVGSLGAMAAQAALRPADTAQTALYSSMMAPRNSEEGASQRRNWAAQDKPDLWAPPKGSSFETQLAFDKAILSQTATSEQTGFGDLKYKGLPGFTGYKNIQKPSWAANVGMDWLLGNKTKERVPTFATTIDSKVEEDTRNSLMLQDTVNSMAIHQKQKFIKDLLDGTEADKFKPDPSLPEADKAKAQAAWQQQEEERQKHIQDTLQRLPIATQIELADLYAAHNAGAVAKKPTFVEERPVTAASTAYNAQQSAKVEKMNLNEQRAKNREIALQSQAAAREHDKEMERQRAQRQMDAASGWTQYGKSR